jgi:hypothetical protein
MSFGAHAPEFSLAHLIAFQHTIFHSISDGRGIHDIRGSDTRTPRKSLYAFYCRWPKIAQTPSRWLRNQLANEGLLFL